MLPTAVSSERRFVMIPPRGGSAHAPSDDTSRHIWEVEPGALLIALSVLLERSELERVFLELEHEDRRGTREDCLLHDAIRLCAMPSPFAEAVEQSLDARTRRVRRRVGASPMSELAGWWLGVRAVAEGQQLTALLWSLARERRWIVRPLLDMVRADLWVRALRLLGEPRRGAPR
jgi:hypothetical protein